MCHTKLVSYIVSNILIPHEYTWMTPLLDFFLNGRVHGEPSNLESLGGRTFVSLCLVEPCINDIIKGRCLNVWLDQKLSTYSKKFMKDSIGTILVLRC